MAKLNPLRKLFLVLALAWMALIYFLSSKAGLDVPPLFVGQDKVAHLLVFGVLGVFIALADALPGEPLRWRQVLFVTLMVTIYGLLDEYHQSFVPGRSPSLWDVVADGLGGLLAALSVRSARNWWLPRSVLLSR